MTVLNHCFTSTVAMPSIHLFQSLPNWFHEVPIFHREYRGETRLGRRKVSREVKREKSTEKRVERRKEWEEQKKK